MFSCVYFIYLGVSCVCFEKIATADDFPFEIAETLTYLGTNPQVILLLERKPLL